MTIMSLSSWGYSEEAPWSEDPNVPEVPDITYPDYIVIEEDPNHAICFSNHAFVPDSRRKHLIFNELDDSCYSVTVVGLPFETRGQKTVSTLREISVWY